MSLIADRRCEVEDCPRSWHSAGYCQLHYTRWKRHGDPLITKARKRTKPLPTPRERPLSLDERFELFTPSRGDGCWEWTGRRQLGPGGRLQYGVIQASPYLYAHRWAYERFNGPIPDGHSIRHRCDNPPCVNPDHLLTGTPGDNSRDKVERGRQHKGVDVPQSRLTEDDVRAIRGIYATGGITQTELASHFNVGLMTINHVVHHRTWKHVA